MADKLFSEPSENSGPALLDREPIVLPQQRKRLVQNLRDRMNNMQG